MARAISWTSVLCLIALLSGCASPSSPSESAAPMSSAPAQEQAPPAEATAPAARETPGASVALQTVCVPFDSALYRGDAFDLVGTLFTSGPTTEATRLVTFVSPGVTPRGYWDGSMLRLGTDNNTSLPRALALAGYAVLTLDRPGIGDSQPAERADRDWLSVGVQVDGMGTTTFPALRSGGFRIANPDSDCMAAAPAAHGFPHIVLGGLSGGGLFTILLAGSFGSNFEGFIPMAWALEQGGHAPGIGTGVVLCADQSTPDSHDLWIPYCPGPNGFSVDCVTYTFNLRVVSEEWARSGCANDSISAEAAGTAKDGGLHFVAYRDARRTAPDLPFLFVYGMNDAYINGPLSDTDLSNANGEIEKWRALCACKEKVSSYFMPDAGHALPLHPNYRDLVAEIQGWLGRVGLGPDA